MISFPQFDDTELYLQIFNQAQVSYGNLRLAIEPYQKRLRHIRGKYLRAPFTALEVRDFFKKIYTDDLYLTTACAEGIEVAWQQFDTIYRMAIHRFARDFSANAEAADELASSVIADLFFVDKLNRPRIASYEGLGPLSRWLRIITRHRALNERPRKCDTFAEIDRVKHSIDETYLETLEARMRADRYRPVIADALKGACQSLTDREQFILAMKYEDLLDSKQIAAIVGVHPSRVTRLEQQMCQKIKRIVISILGQQYGLHEAAVKECLTDLVENPEHSLLKYLKAS